jgi:Phytochelatin synthase
MRRKLTLGAVALLSVLLGLFGGTAVLLQQTKVPLAAIQSSVTRSQELLDHAWQLPVASTFERRVVWQSNPSVCGAASLANAFRSWAEAPATEADVLSGVRRCWFRVCFIGLTLDQLAEVAQAHTKRKVTVIRDLSPEAFREVLRKANDPGRRYIVNFSRAAIFGAGVGHHSPIGGYLEAEDLVFVLDVNRQYQPWLIERSRLFAAMDTFDGERKRGLLLIE